jgi:hypothetical protein
MTQRRIIETPIMFDVRSTLADAGAWCMRNNTGFDRVRKIHYGIGLGGADLVNIAVGRFIGIEVKAPRGTASEDQKRWAFGVRAAGGFYAIAKTPEAARDALLRARMCTCPTCGASITPTWSYDR